MARLTQQQLETHLWGAATILRGRTAGQDYKTYILSLMFFKRLSDQWDYEGDERIKELERDRGEPFSDVHRAALRSTGAIHRFTIPEGCHWNDVLQAAQNIGEVLTKAMRGIADANKELVGVFTVDWNQPAPDGKGKLIANNVVHALVQHFHTVNLSNANVEPDIIGRAYEYLRSRHRGGKSTLSDPLFLKLDGSLDQFDIVLANFPFSDEMWWLPEDQHTEEQAKKAKKQLGKEGFQDKHHRFVFGNPPASYGDYAVIQHGASGCRFCFQVIYPSSPGLLRASGSPL